MHYLQDFYNDTVERQWREGEYKQGFLLLCWANPMMVTLIIIMYKNHPHHLWCLIYKCFVCCFDGIRLPDNLHNSSYYCHTSHPPVCDGTQNVERYRYRYFFPVPNIFDTDTGTFFRYQILPIPVPRLFSGTNFFRYHQKNSPSVPVPIRYTS